MKILNLLTLSLLVLALAACGGKASKDGAGQGDGSTSRPSAVSDPDKKQPGTEPGKAGDVDAVAEMRRGIKALESRPEHTADEVTVQHILIGFRDARGGANLKNCSIAGGAEAEKLAAELCARIRKGEDFAALMADYSDDSGTGTYIMKSASGDYPPRGSIIVRARSGMVPAFGNVGWRLEVGEVGVAPYDPVKSPYGLHIVKRVK